MKKPLFFALLTVLFCALFAVSLAACSDDKAPEPAPSAPNLESPEQDNGSPDDSEPPDTKTTYIIKAKETSTEKFVAPYDASFAFLPQNADVKEEGDVYTYNGNPVLVAITGETFIPEVTGKSLAALAEDNSEAFIFDAGENTKNDYSKFIAAYAECCNEDGLHVLTYEMKTLLDLYAAAKGLDLFFACGVYTADNPDLTTGEGSESIPYAISAEKYNVKVATGRTLYFSAEELLMITSGDDIVTMTYEEKTYTAGNIEGDIEFDCEEDSTFAVTVTDGSEATITFTAVEIKVKEGGTSTDEPEEISLANIAGEYCVHLFNNTFCIKITNNSENADEKITLKITLKTENVTLVAITGYLSDEATIDGPGVDTITINPDDFCTISMENPDDLFVRFSIEIVETQE